uniref:Zinc finger protein Rlf/292/654 TPR repeats domain-containing protein n=2 Tax=Lygus hesperus TaxID=30085 RepID=A0A0A9WP34_LYGHE
MEDNIKIQELENVLLEESKPYTDKLDAVVSTWKYFYEQANDKESPEVLNQVLPALYRAAVRIILHGDWPRLKHVTRRKFTSLIKRCNQYLYRKFPDSAKKCKTLTFLWVDPWDHPTLRLILEKATAPDEDVCSLINHEGSELLFLRLEAMCEGKCEDLALQLAACYLKHLKQSVDCHDIVVDDMNDIFIALLYKFNKKQEVIDMLKAMPISDGIKLISRFCEKSKNKGRLWKHFDKMKYVACNTLLDMTMDICMDLEEDRQSLCGLIEEWINLNIAAKMSSDESLKQVSEIVRRLIGTAGSARHIYIFTQVLNNKYGGRVKLLCIELYIRGLSLNLNEIEELKALADEKLIKANKDLADGFLQLAELFSGNESVCRECILSSFSLFPTKETLHRIQTLLQVEDTSKCPVNCVDSRRLEKCSYHNQYNCTCGSNFLSLQLDPDILKSAPHLPDDLATVLSRSRSKLLTWSLGKNLDRECQKYLKNYKGPEFKTQELQYLNIDYSQFKDWPKDKEETSKPIKSNESPTNKPKIRKVGGATPRNEATLKRKEEGQSKHKNKTSDSPSKARNRLKRKSNLSPTSSKDEYSPRPSYGSDAVTNLISTAASTTFNDQPWREIDYSFNGDFIISKSRPLTNSVGTLVALPRCKAESSTQTEPQYLACQANDATNAGTSSASSKHVMVSKHNDSNGPALLQMNHISPSGSSAKCTTPVSSLEFNKPVRTYFNRKTANLHNNPAFNSYLNNHSPKPAEVPPTASSDIRIQEKLKPILKSLDMNPKVVLEDILSINRSSTQLPRESPEKAGFPYPRENLDILAQAVMRSDILLAKSVPGMNSVDMIVPQPQETAVHVVQISNSTPVLSQPAVTNVASSSISHSIHASSTSSATNIIQANNPTALSRVKTNDPAFQVDCATSSHLPDLSKTHDANSFIPSTSDSSASTSLIPSSSSVGTRINSIQLHSSNSQLPAGRSPLKSNLLTASEQLSMPTEVPCSSQQEGTLVTAHIQRVGQPSKQRNAPDLVSRTNCTNQSTSNDESNKVTSSQVFRLIVKDGRVVEQYYQGNQSLEPVLSIPDNEDSEILPNVSNSYNHDHFIKLLKKKNDLKTKQVNKGVDSSQVSSLPKFHHVFGRQIYQSDTMSLENSSMSSHTQYEERSNAEVKGPTDVLTTGLSKGVQTVLKDNDPPGKTLEKPRAEVQTQLTASVLPPSTSNAGVGADAKEIRHSTEIPSSSGVIFTCKVPISIANNQILQGKPVTILKTSSADSMPCSKVVDSGTRSKDSVIRSGNMNALLAAALQSSSPIKHTVINNPNSTPVTVSGVKHIKVNNADGIMMQKIRMPTPVQKNIRRQAPLPSRYIRPMIQVSTGNSMTQTGPPVVTIPLPARTVVLATNVNQNTMQSSLSKIETRQDHLNSDQPSVSSTTLEQLREFESVLEQVTNTSQMKERGNVKKVEHQPTQTSSTDFSAAASKVNPIFQSSLVSTISDLNNESVSLTFINKNVSSSSSSMVTSNPSKIATSTPVVVVQSCSRPLASPALSITSQSSLSPAPQTSPAHIQTKIGAKVNKPKIKSSVGKTAPAATIKVSTLPKPQQKPQEDEQTTQRIYAILDKYAEQLRNSPELKNKPAPRRRSNPPTNPTQSSKRKKSSHNKSKNVTSLPTCSGSEMSPGSEDLRTLGSEDSSNGVSQLSQVLNSPQSRNDEHSNPPGGDVSSETSESLDSKDQRSQHRILLTEPSSSSGRTVLVQENIQPLINVDGPKVLAGKQLVVGSGATVPLTLSLPAGNVKQVIFPVPADGRPFVVAKVPKMYRVHQVTMPTGSPLLATAGSGAVVLRQMCLNKANTGVKQVKLPVVSQIPGQGLNTITSQPAVVLPSGSQSFTLATSSGLDGDSLGITLDNTILLNTSTSQSLGFFQRNVTKSVGSQQSPNLLVPSNRASIETDTSASQFPGTPESASHVKCESTLSNHVIRTISDDQNKTSNLSSQTPSSFKTEDIHFNVTSEIISEKQPTSTPELMKQNAKNWTRMLEDTKGESSLNNEENKSADPDLKAIKPEFHKTSRSDASVDTIEMKSENQGLKVVCQSDSVIKSKLKEEPRFSEGRVLQDSAKACLSLQQDSSDQWQFNLSKVERSSKDLKMETTSSQEIVKPNTSILLNNLNHSIGVKRKVNVENTIFQVAFKRSDKLRLVKDEFIHQRNSSSTLEREIRLQKSLSEECEDLGVDKPRTSELFPEAELLLDSDPLSRDSLQELYSRGMESSSSSHDSPMRSSPTVLSDNSHSKFSSLSWKKQKNSSMSKSNDSNSEKMMLKLERLENKSESSCESSPLNGSNEPSNSAISHVKSLNSGHMSLKPNQGSMKKEDSIPSGSRDEMASPDSDACHFSEVDDSCIAPDLMDSDGESDSDSQSHTCKTTEYQGMIEPMHENESNDKSSDFTISSGQKCNNCTYQVSKDEPYKRKMDMQWFNIDQESDKVCSNPGDNEDSPNKMNREEPGNDNSLNGILLDDWNSHRDDSITERNLRRSRSGGSTFYRELNSPKAKRKKKPSIFVSSAGEDSGSSMDTLLTGGSDELEMDSLSRRSSVRGRVKKGCPCLNGSTDPTKKKKDLCTGPFVKTDRPCLSKSVNCHMSPTKKPQKTPIKPPTKKR